MGFGIGNVRGGMIVNGRNGVIRSVRGGRRRNLRE